MNYREKDVTALIEACEELFKKHPFVKEGEVPMAKVRDAVHYVKENALGQVPAYMIDDATVQGKSKKTYLTVDLNKLGMSDVSGAFLTVNSDNLSYKIKTNYTGVRKKIHLTKDLFRVVAMLVKRIENGHE